MQNQENSMCDHSPSPLLAEGLNQRGVTGHLEIPKERVFISPRSTEGSKKGRFQHIDRLLLASLVLVTVFVTHYLCTVTAVYDSLWMTYTTMSILRVGNTTLDAYREIIQEKDYRIDIVDGHLYNRLPIGTSIIELPAIFLIDKLHGSPWPADLYEYMKHNQPEPIVPLIDKLVGSLVVALTATIIYMLASRFLDQKGSILVCAIFAYGTSAWSTASRGLWSHGPSMLMLTIVLFLFVKARTDPNMVQFTGLFLAMSYIIRPTNALSVLILTGLVFIQYRDYFGRFLIWALPVALLFFIYNLNVYHTWLAPIYRPEVLRAAGQLWEGLAGTLINPSRGLFIYSPILLFSIYGIVVKVRRSQMTALDYSLVVIILLHWILISDNQSWEGGWCYGPRYFTDVVPYLIFLLIPAISHITGLVRVQKFVWYPILVVLFATSLLIHFRGATSWDGMLWHSEPTPYYQRLWDWHDPQFLRGIALSSNSSFP